MTRDELKLAVTFIAWIAAWLILICAIACDNPAPTGPTIPPPTNPPPVERPREDTPPVLTDIVGATAFSLTIRDEFYIRSFVERLIAHGYNCARVGSELEFWSGGMHPTGPSINEPVALENVDKVLRVTAEFPNFYVQLVVVFTIKHGRPMNEQRRWAEKVADVASKYRHVFFSAINEPYAHARYTNGEIISLLDILKRTGKHVGVDQPAGAGQWTYTRSLRRHVTYLAMHTQRNPEPNVKELRQIASKNGLVLLDETTAYASQREVRMFNLAGDNNIYLGGYGSEDDRRHAALDYMKRVKQFPALRWFFHSVELLRCETLDFWMPKY